MSRFHAIPGFVLFCATQSKPVWRVAPGGKQMQRHKVSEQLLCLLVVLSIAIQNLASVVFPEQPALSILVCQ